MTRSQVASKSNDDSIVEATNASAYPPLPLDIPYNYNDNYDNSLTNSNSHNDYLNDSPTATTHLHTYNNLHDNHLSARLDSRSDMKKVPPFIRSHSSPALTKSNIHNVQANLAAATTAESAPYNDDNCDDDENDDDGQYEVKPHKYQQISNRIVSALKDDMNRIDGRQYQLSNPDVYNGHELDSTSLAIIYRPVSNGSSGVRPHSALPRMLYHSKSQQSLPNDTSLAPTLSMDHWKQEPFDEYFTANTLTQKIHSVGGNGHIMAPLTSHRNNQPPLMNNFITNNIQPSRQSSMSNRNDNNGFFDAKNDQSMAYNNNINNNNNGSTISKFKQKLTDARLYGSIILIPNHVVPIRIRKRRAVLTGLSLTRDNSQRSGLSTSLRQYKTPRSAQTNKHLPITYPSSSSPSRKQRNNNNDSRRLSPNNNRRNNNTNNINNNNNNNNIMDRRNLSPNQQRLYYGRNSSIKSRPSSAAYATDGMTNKKNKKKRLTSANGKIPNDTKGGGSRDWLIQGDGVADDEFRRLSSNQSSQSLLIKEYEKSQAFQAVLERIQAIRNAQFNDNHISMNLNNKVIISSRSQPFLINRTDTQFSLGKQGEIVPTAAPAAVNVAIAPTIGSKTMRSPMRVSIDAIDNSNKYQGDNNNNKRAPLLVKSESTPSIPTSAVTTAVTVKAPKKNVTIEVTKPLKNELVVPSTTASKAVASPGVTKVPRQTLSSSSSSSFASHKQVQPPQPQQQQQQALLVPVDTGPVTLKISKHVVMEGLRSPSRSPKSEATSIKNSGIVKSSSSVVITGTSSRFREVKRLSRSKVPIIDADSSGLQPLKLSEREVKQAIISAEEVTVPVSSVDQFLSPALPSLVNRQALIADVVQALVEKALSRLKDIGRIDQQTPLEDKPSNNFVKIDLHEPSLATIEVKSQKGPVQTEEYDDDNNKAPFTDDEAYHACSVISSTTAVEIGMRNALTRLQNVPPLAIEALLASTSKQLQQPLQETIIDDSIAQIDACHVLSETELSSILQKGLHRALIKLLDVPTVVSGITTVDQHHLHPIKEDVGSNIDLNALATAARALYPETIHHPPFAVINEPSEIFHPFEIDEMDEMLMMMVPSIESSRDDGVLDDDLIEASNAMSEPSEIVHPIEIDEMDEMMMMMVPSIESSRDDGVLDDDDDLIEASFYAMSEAITSMVVEMGIQNALKRLRDDDVIDIDLNIEEEGSENNQDLTALAASVVVVGQSIDPNTSSVEVGRSDSSANIPEVSVDDDDDDDDQSKRYALQSLASESSLHCIDRAVKGVNDTLVRHHIEASLKAVEILAMHVSRYCLHQSIVSIYQWLMLYHNHMFIINSISHMIRSTVEEVLQFLKPSIPESKPSPKPSIPESKPSPKPSIPESKPSSPRVDELESLGVELSMAIDLTSHITALGVDLAMEELLMSPLLRMDKIISTSITTTSGPPSDLLLIDPSPPSPTDPFSFTESYYDSWDGTMEDSTVSYTGTVSIEYYTCDCI